MKRFKRQIHRHGIFVASLLLIAAILLPVMRTATRPMTMQEFLLIQSSREMLTITLLRGILLALVLLNASLVYALLSAWFAKRRAGLTIFVLASMPVWLLMQIAVPRFTLVLTAALVTLWSFDRAGRSDKRAPLWYLLCGLACTAGWLLEPIGVTSVLLVGLLLLIGIKPRYVRHIARQASLVPIILVATVSALSLASWKFGLGAQDYLVRRLSEGIHIMIMPKLLLQGPTQYYIGLPGVSLVPVAIAVLAGLGAWQLFVARKRPRNLYILALPILLMAIGLQFRGMSSLLLLSIAMIAIAVWTVMGVQYLHVSWQRVFPRNRLANSLGNLLIASMLASLALYSFWYINRAWNGNPQSRQDARIEWNGTL